MNTKSCTNCKLIKTVQEFRLCKSSKSGLQSWCKECQDTYRKSEKAKAYQKELRKNPTYQLYQKNYQKQYKQTASYKAYKKAYDKQFNQLNQYDTLYKLKRNLRIRTINALKRSQKAGSAVKDLGCSIEQLKQYLESKFQPGMTWDNWSRDGWHIDHIRPLASFDLTDREQLKQACHFTNLQPLWSEENLAKGSQVIGE